MTYVQQNQSVHDIASSKVISEQNFYRWRNRNPNLAHTLCTIYINNLLVSNPSFYPLHAWRRQLTTGAFWFSCLVVMHIMSEIRIDWKFDDAPFDLWTVLYLSLTIAMRVLPWKIGFWKVKNSLLARSVVIWHIVQNSIRNITLDTLFLAYIVALLYLSTEKQY